MGNLSKDAKSRFQGAHQCLKLFKAFKKKKKKSKIGKHPESLYEGKKCTTGRNFSLKKIAGIWLAKLVIPH